MAERATCETCSYFSRYEHPEDESGECRRRAPSEGQGEEGDNWAVVSIDEWCGEHPDFQHSKTLGSGVTAEKIDEYFQKLMAGDDDAWKALGRAHETLTEPTSTKE